MIFSEVANYGRSIYTGLIGTFWITTFEKNALLLHKNTAFEPTCEVARNSPDKAKSIESGAFLNYIQSIKLPVRISYILKDLSKDEHNSHLLSGREKHRSVILLFAAFGKERTNLRPPLTLRMLIERSLMEIAIKLFSLL